MGYGVGEQELQGRGADKAAPHSAAHAVPQVMLVVRGAHRDFSGGLGHLVIQVLEFRSSLHGCAALAKATELVRWETALTAALCQHGSCLSNTYSPSLPLLLLLHLGKGCLIYCLCPAELNRSKLMIEETTGDDAPQPVGSMSHFVALCKCCLLCFFFFFFFLFSVLPSVP